MISPQLLNDIEAFLVGTTNSLSEVAEQHGLNEDKLLEAIGEHGEIDLCADCGWWCETSELAEKNCELVCEDCREA